MTRRGERVHAVHAVDAVQWPGCIASTPGITKQSPQNSTGDPMLPNSPTQLDETRLLSVLRLRAVKERTGLSQSGIYAKMSRGEFPRSIPLGGKAIGWRSDEIAAWIEAQTAKRDAKSIARPDEIEVRA